MITPAKNYQRRNAAIAQRIFTRRVQMGISQAQLAEMMRTFGHGWDQSTVSKTESGERPLRLAEAVSLAEALSLSVIELADLAKPSTGPREARLAHLVLAAVREYEAGL